jgi:hypothetical protein
MAEILLEAQAAGNLISERPVEGEGGGRGDTPAILRVRLGYLLLFPGTEDAPKPYASTSCLRVLSAASQPQVSVSLGAWIWRRRN